MISAKAFDTYRLRNDSGSLLEHERFQPHPQRRGIRRVVLAVLDYFPKSFLFALAEQHWYLPCTYERARTSMTGTDRSSDRDRKLRIVIFSGRRGSTVLSKELLADPRISLTLAINGYDDGLSTGEIRRFLGQALGPSDFRKNANRLAAELNTCPKELLEILETR